MSCVCGIYDCGDCNHSNSGKCIGCRAENENLKALGRAACGVYECAQSRGIKSCVDCPNAVCLLKRSVESICPLRAQFESSRWWAGRMSRALEVRRKRAPGCSEGGAISEKVVSRLRWDPVALDLCASKGDESISSWRLAEMVGSSAALIRKDLSRFGEFGTPSFGYEMGFLRERIRGILHLDKPRGVIWIGGSSFRLFRPLVDRLSRQNCVLRGVFEVDPGQVGGTVDNWTIRSIADAGALAEIGRSILP